MLIVYTNRKKILLLNYKYHEYRYHYAIDELYFQADK